MIIKREKNVQISLGSPAESASSCYVHKRMASAGLKEIAASHKAKYFMPFLLNSAFKYRGCIAVNY